MLLTCDIGNTNITLGVFQGDHLRATWRVATDPRHLPDEYMALLSNLLPLKDVSASDITEAALCSVVPTLTPTFEELCRSYFHVDPLVVTTGVKTGVKILYDNPRDVGADRIADAAAAFHLYGGPVIIVDFGTATVFDAISKEGDYLGGALVPGINIAADALYLNTSQLRRVELVRPKTAIGKSTIHALQSGLVLGYISLVEGMVARFREELGERCPVIATGGLAELIAKDAPIFDHVNPDLTLVGLRLIYEMNKEG